MTDKPYTGEFRWQGEPQSSLIERWDGIEWVLVSTPEPTDEELHRLMHNFVLGGESPEDFSFDHCGFARAVLARWGNQ